MKRVSVFILSKYIWFGALIVVVLAVLTLYLGCSVITDFDPDMINNRQSGNAIKTEGGTEQSTLSADGGPADRPTASTDGKRLEGTGIDRSTSAIDANVECLEASDCPNFADPCFNTRCVDGFCETTEKTVDMKCNAECGTIVDACGNTVQCGHCEAGLVCVNHKCVSECAGCEINGTCHAVGTVNPANQCEMCSPQHSADSWSPNSGALCDDGKFCTVSDVCVGVVCSGTSRNCDDGIDCNGLEICSEADGSCLLGTPTCGAGEYCDAASNACVSICGQTDCIINRTCIPNGDDDTANPCLVCDSAINKNEWSVAVGRICGDAETECFANDTCDASGNCIRNHTPEGTHCGSSRTECSGQDTCDGRGNCVANHYGSRTACGPAPAQCENQDYCDGNGNCVNEGFMVRDSLCGQGPTVCSRQDTCDGNGVCRPNDYQNGTWCGEGDSACSWYECRQGSCDRLVSGEACDDRNPCTSDGCRDHNNNCLQGRPLADGTRCGNGDSQCSWYQCDDGECGTELVHRICDDDGIACTIDTCDPKTGRCNRPDDDYCDDGIACTIDRCDPNNGCVYDDRECRDAGTGSRECRGSRLFNRCWYLTGTNQSCERFCTDHRGFDPTTANYIGSSAQGGSLENCRAILNALGYSADVAAGSRNEGPGLGCHIWESNAWWLDRPDFDSSASYSLARIVCACHQ